MNPLAVWHVENGLKVSFGGAYFVPVGPVEFHAADFTLTYQFKPDGEDRELFFLREHVGDLLLHDVSTGKLVGTGVDAESVAHIRDLAGFGVEAYIAVAVHATQCHGDEVTAAVVRCQQISQRNVGQDVPVVYNDGAIFPEVKYFFMPPPESSGSSS